MILAGELQNSTIFPESFSGAVINRRRMFFWGISVRSE
jgi:hypothetical protein